MADFLMPSLGADMEAGTLRAWRRSPGDWISRGDIIAEVETDKGIIEVEAFDSGIVDRVLVEPGTRVPVGTLLAVIRTEDGPVPSSSPSPSPSPSPLPSPSPSPSFALPTPGVRATPLARRRAHELSLDLSSIRGTGPEGAITAEDVEIAATSARAPAAPPPSAPPATDPRAAMRRAIAVAMTRSKREVPHFYVATTVDMAPALAWLGRINASAAPEERIIPGALLLKAVALALRKVPELNARWDGEGAPPLPDIHVGSAVSLRGGGLIAPAIHDTDKLGLATLMARLRDLVERARAGALRSSEMSDATITVSSLGERGVEELIPIIVPPQVAIVGVGKIVERPWVVDGAVVPRPVVRITLAADHRVADGHRAGLFLATVESLIAGPEELA